MSSEATMPQRPATKWSLRNSVPWWAKLIYKLLLVPLPIRHELIRKMGHKHGGMDNPEWAWAAFGRHLDESKTGQMPQGFTVLELGPGDSLFTALMAYSAGAAATYIVDVGPMATTDVNLYRQMALFLQAKGLRTPDLSNAATIDDVLASCNARYLTSGLASLRELTTASVDFIFSSAVLQHVLLEQFPQTLAELRRVIKPSGVSVHSIDLRDMMGKELHQLKFPVRIWESAPFQRAFFYTNRLRHHEMVAGFRAAGFDVETIEENRWPRLPVSKASLSPHYRAMSDGQLNIFSTVVIARPVSQPQFASGIST